MSPRHAGEAVEPLPEQGVSDIPVIRKPSKETTWLGPKESAVRQHRQEMKTKMKTNKVEEVKPARPKQVRARQNTDWSTPAPQQHLSTIAAAVWKEQDFI